jgi:hypothetical protein
MKKSPIWKDNSRSSTEGITRFLQNQNLHYHVHKFQPLVSTLNQTNPLHNILL